MTRSQEGKERGKAASELTDFALLLNTTAIEFDRRLSSLDRNIIRLY